MDEVQTFRLPLKAGKPGMFSATAFAHVFLTRVEDFNWVAKSFLDFLYSDQVAVAVVFIFKNSAVNVYYLESMLAIRFYIIKITFKQKK
jgi:hypothetical protein